MKFDRYPISDEIKDSLYRLGFKKPTDIQYKSIPHILKGEDVLAIAQTGTGKTAAFAIPILNNLQVRKNPRRPDGIKCLVMVPTRELAIQITEVLKTIGSDTRLNIFCIHGGVEQDPQISKLEKGIDLLVATPGRMFDLVSQGYIKFNRLETLIIDEADHMLARGFLKDIQDLIRFLPSKRQTLFFSATINQEIKDLAYSLVRNPIRIQVSPKDPVSKNVDHAIAFIEMDEKRFFLERIIKEYSDSKILVFVRTKVRAERVVKAMKRVSIESVSLHGDKAQEDRLQILDAFKKDKVRLLIATDVSARGIDIPNVDYVVNYDMPEPSENYVHRVGRTGRGRQRGRAISFCSEQEKGIYEAITNYLGKPIKEMEIDRKTYTATVNFSEQPEGTWQSLLKQAEIDEIKYQKIKKKRRK